MPVAAARPVSLVAPDAISVWAAHLGERIETRPLAGERVDPTAVVVYFGVRGRAVVFRFGSLVAFGGTDAERDQLLESLVDHVRERCRIPEAESTIAELSASRPEGIHDGAITLRADDVTRLVTVADVLAKSVALASYEQAVEEVFGEVDALARALERTGRAPPRSRALTRRIGAALLMETQIVGRAEVEEKPELLWERPDLERLWELLVSEYELRERSRAMSRKLELAGRATGAALDLIQNRRALRVEVMIVVLIVVEVVITMYELLSARL